MRHKGYQRLEDPIVQDERSCDLGPDCSSQGSCWSTKKRYRNPSCPCNWAGLAITIIICLSTNLITAFFTIRWMEHFSNASNEHTFYCKFSVTVSSPYHVLTIFSPHPKPSTSTVFYKANRCETLSQRLEPGSHLSTSPQSCR